MKAPRERGAALLTAMVIVTLVATLAAAMLWQQWRAVQVETAERARSQSQWILTGAVDWARLILREDAVTGGADHLGEPWAVPLAEAKLSTFLASDRENTDDAPEAFLSGSIVDAQARYNLRNLTDPQPLRAATELAILQRLLDAIGVRADLASRLAQALRDAAPPAPPEPASGASDAAGESPPVARSADPPLMPERLSQLVWLGVDAEAIAKLTPYVVLLPMRTPINLNTAPKEVLAAVLGVDFASAERLLQARQRGHFTRIEDARSLLPPETILDARHIAVTSRYFEIRGRLRLEDRVVEQHALVERRGRQVVTLQRERVAAVESVGN